MGKKLAWLVGLGMLGAVPPVVRADEAESQRDSGRPVQGDARTGLWFVSMARVFNELETKHQWTYIIDDKDIGIASGTLLDMGFDFLVYGSHFSFDYFTDQLIDTAEQRIVGGNKLAQQALRMLVGRIEPNMPIGNARLVLGARHFRVDGPIARPEQFEAFDNRRLAPGQQVSWSTRLTAAEVGLAWGHPGKDVTFGPVFRYTHYTMPSAMIAQDLNSFGSLTVNRFLVTSEQDVYDAVAQAHYVYEGEGLLRAEGGCELGIGLVRMTWPRFGEARGLSIPVAGDFKVGLNLRAGPVNFVPFAGFRFSTWVPLVPQPSSTEGGDGIVVDHPEATANWVIVYGPQIGLEAHL